jgi:F0F1-type ATP synthase membrane subunit c/vacuolar-type H+-ATPase subunit K
MSIGSDHWLSWKAAWTAIGAAGMTVGLSLAGVWVAGVETAAPRPRGPSLASPYLFVVGLISLAGVYAVVAALAGWPLPGRKAAVKEAERLHRSERGLSLKAPEQYLAEATRHLADTAKTLGELIEELRKRSGGGG